MRTYKFNDSGTTVASNNQELVQRLNSESFFGYRKQLEDFMKDTAKACKLQKGVNVRTTNMDIFIEDLIKFDFLKDITNA